MRVTLLSYTKDAERLCASAAHSCYSDKPASELMEEWDETKGARWLGNPLASGHHSVIEHASYTFSIEGVSRVLTHQLVRHRVASYCVTGDTIVVSDNPSRSVKKRTIKSLYDMHEQYQKMVKIRCIDYASKMIQSENINQVIYSGLKDVFRVITNDGYEIKSTMEHRFLTNNGFEQLSSLSVGDKVYTNGIEPYKDREWLSDAYINKSLSQEKIAYICGVSKHTICAWVKKHGIQKPMGSWCVGKSPPNFGRTKVDYEPLSRVSRKMKGIYHSTKRYGSDNPMFKGDAVSIGGAYQRAHRIFEKRQSCSLCGSDGVETQIHHIDHNPRNHDESNLIELCIKCHKIVHKGFVIKCVRLSTIRSIEYVGQEETYDIEMKGPHHNFIANGFVVHNSQQSQRYVKLEEAEYVVPPTIAADPELEKRYRALMEHIWAEYEALAKKVPVEDARYILPNACATNITVTMNARELWHFFELRTCRRAQHEIREMADEMLRQAQEASPFIFKNAGPPCISRGRCPEGKMSCGKPRNELRRP